MALYSKLNRKPIFQPQVGSFPQGMVVSVPLHYEGMDGASGVKIHEALREWYKDSQFVEVMELEVSCDGVERTEWSEAMS